MGLLTIAWVIIKPVARERHTEVFLSASEYLSASGIDLVICDLGCAEVNKRKVGC